MNGVQPRLTAMPNSPFEHLSWHRSWWSWFNHTFFCQHSICAILSWQVINYPCVTPEKNCPKHTVLLNWHHCKVTLSRLAREVLIVGKGCLTCALHSGQKTVDMEQMLEKLVCTCKMFHALWMRLDDLIQKDHGPVYISGHFHKARIRIFAVSIIIHFVSILCVDMPILNWPSTQAIFWWGRGDPHWFPMCHLSIRSFWIL